MANPMTIIASLHEYYFLFIFIPLPSGVLMRVGQFAIQFSVPEDEPSMDDLTWDIVPAGSRGQHPLLSPALSVSTDLE